VFLLHLLLVLAAAIVHVVRLPARTASRIGEIGLRYLLVGYCGLPMVILSLVVLIAPEHASAHLPIPDGGMVLAFLGWAYLGMSLSAVLALGHRGAYLLGPALVWGTFFAGVTVVHVREFLAQGTLTFTVALYTFVTHTLVAILLFTTLVASRGARRDPG